MGRSPTVLAATTAALVERASAEGLDRQRLLLSAGISPEALADPRARIARDADTAVWSTVHAELGHADFGLRFAESLQPDAFGAVGFLAMASPDVRRAIGRAAAYHRVVKDDATTRLTEIPEGLWLEELLPPGHPRWSRPIVDYALATYVVLLRKWTGVSLRPRFVSVPYARPRDLSLHDRVFGCPIRFDQPTIGLVFDHDTLALPLLTAQPAYEAFLARLAEEALAGLVHTDLADEVRAVIAERLGAADLDLEVVARSLGTSARTLQRRLGESDLTFQRLVDEVRRATALPLLVESDLSIDAISERLGYAESAAFRRAFRRWTGVAPSAIRRDGRSPI